MKLEKPIRFEWMAAAGALAGALLLFAAFAPLAKGGAAWVALALLWLPARLLPMRKALFMGWAGLFVFWLLSIRWLTNVTTIGWVLLCAYCALYVWPTLLLASKWRRPGMVTFATGMAVVWSGSEFLRNWFCTGFGWNPLGVSQVEFLQVLWPAEWGGVWLVSGLVAWVNACVLYALPCPGAETGLTRRGWIREGILTGVLIALGCGGYFLRTPQAAPGPEMRVALIQPAIPQDEKWSASKFESVLLQLFDLTKQAIQSGESFDLIIWPETAIPEDMRSSEMSWMVISALLEGGRTPILAGSLDSVTHDDQSVAYFNASLLFDAQGRIQAQYDKRHLVAFGEFIPLRWLVPRAVQVALRFPENLTAGTKGTVARLDAEAPAFSPLICFEDILPHLARADVRQGSRMLINQTNDAWFDPTGAQEQHMRNAIFRAVENRVPMIRVANTGMTCVIQPDGRVAERLVGKDGDSRAEGFLITTVAGAPNGMSLTFYTRYGDIFGVSCAIVVVAWLVAVSWPGIRRFVVRRFPTATAA